MLKIGYVSYLNALPLVHDLQALLPDAELICGPPAHLADLLQQKAIDIGLAPVIEIRRHPEYKIVSNAVIAADGAVESVVVFSTLPLEKVKTLRLDAQSCTSNILARLLFLDQIKREPRYILPAKDDCLEPCPTSVETDAIVCIGDRALRLLYKKCWPHAYDLGVEWKSLTGLPFVFAAWLARPDVKTQQVESALCKARDLGVQHIDEIARVASPKIDISEEACRNYLANRIQYQLTDNIREGLDHFLQRSAVADL